MAFELFSGRLMALRGEFMVGGPEAVTAYCMRRAKVCPTAPPHCLGQATPGLIDPSPKIVMLKSYCISGHLCVSSAQHWSNISSLSWVAG